MKSLHDAHGEMKAAQRRYLRHVRREGFPSPGEEELYRKWHALAVTFRRMLPRVEVALVPVEPSRFTNHPRLKP